MVDNTVTTSELPAAVEPKNLQSGAAGFIAGLAAWAWNQWQTVEKCTNEMINGLASSVCELAHGTFYLDGPQYAAFVAFIMFATGPVLRKLALWDTQTKIKKSEMRELIDELRKYNAKQP